MGEQTFSYSIDNDRKFRNAVKRAVEQVGDLTIPLTLIAKDFFKSEKAIWMLSSPGQYPDLAESTKKDRVRRGQPLYPILRRSGALERSVTDPTDSNSINAILNGGRTLVIGTHVQYGIYHQSDLPRKKIPLRKFLFVGPESQRWAVGDQAGRLQRWMGIIDGFVGQKLAVLGTYKGGV